MAFSVSLKINLFSLRPGPKRRVSFNPDLVAAQATADAHATAAATHERSLLPSTAGRDFFLLSTSASFM